MIARVPAASAFRLARATPRIVAGREEELDGLAQALAAPSRRGAAARPRVWPPRRPLPAFDRVIGRDELSSLLFQPSPLVLVCVIVIQVAPHPDGGTHLTVELHHGLFCGNDGINRTDYLGNSWLSRFLKFTRKATRDVLNVATLGTLRAPINHLYTWGENHQQELKIAAAIIISFYTFGAASGSIYAAGADATATSLGTAATGVLANGVAAGTVSATFATTAAGIVGGAAAGAAGGLIMTGTVQGTLQGAASGAIMGGVAGYYGNSWANPLQRIAATAVGGGVASEVSGGSFRQGAIIAGAFAVAAAYYDHAVRYPANASPGGDAVMKNGTTGPVEGANNMGLESSLRLDQRTGFMEGSSLSNVLDRPPGMNAIAGLHDAWWHAFPDNSTTFRILNVPSMLPAAAVSIAAIAGQYPGVDIALIDGHR